VSVKDVSFTTTHLTSFGAGFFVKPNTIDFSSVFAKAGFADNLTIYLTIIVTLGLYLLLLVWARLKDKKDVEQVQCQIIRGIHRMNKAGYIF
jgi:hypothetical protein